MTHEDIYIKFMIEYDKANVVSSYPSLTEYEVATVLDKAYNALIAQKVTGNNVRRATFESDIKSIADLGPLVVTDQMNTDHADYIANNVARVNVPDDMLYFLQANLNYVVNTNKIDPNEMFQKYNPQGEPFDYQTKRKLPVKLVNHEIAQKFFASAFNMPWIKEPVCYIEGNNIYVVYDPLDVPDVNIGKSSSQDKTVDVVYIKTPNKFVKDVDEIKADEPDCEVSFFWCRPKGSNKVKSTTAEKYIFECNDTVAEELISLAIAFALENIESTRLNSKLNMRGLEA